MRAATDYTAREMMVLAAARMIRDDDIVLCGTGMSMLAAVAAKHIYAPGAVLFFESGAVDPGLADLPLAVSDARVMTGAAVFSTLTDAFSYIQNPKTGARVVGIIGAAQIDAHGSLNSTMIGDYGCVDARFPGSGGACDILSLAGKTLVFMTLEKRRFVNQLAYTTSPGWQVKGKARQDLGLEPHGPEAVITDKGIFKFAEGRIYLDQYYPGIDPDTIPLLTEFPVDISRAVQASPPDPFALSILREKTDPERLILDAP